MQPPVLAGVDGTPASLLAAGWAAGEARRLRAPLVLLHGYEALAGTPRLLLGDPGLEHRAAMRLLTDAQAWVRQHYDDIDVVTELAVRPEADLLTEWSRDAQMIVLGSRRPGPVSGFFLGSIGLRVLSRAECPVVLIRSDSAARPQEQEVVAGVPEEEDQAQTLLAFAFQAAATRGVALRAVRAWKLPALFTYEPGLAQHAAENNELEQAHRRELAAVLQPWRKRHPEVEVIEHVEVGPAAEVLVALAASAQLLVVGRSSKPGRRYVGHVAHATLHFADAPIALVPTR
ncbi:universal stress protein [Streptomyces sp. NPDC004082]|uniref:universal stress protein n=1 Tax=Streptomyces sp. NPDC005496 TaxID=3364716 RepID=UPI00369F172B